MTQFSKPPLPGGIDPVPYPAGAPLSTDVGGLEHQREEPSTADVAKDQAARVTNTAVDAGKHVANVAGEQAGQVASEATHQVKALVARTRDELTEQAAAQQQRVARGLRSLGTDLQSMAHGSPNSGMATDLVQQVSERTNTVAAWLEQREPGHVLDEVTGFARRRPGAFLALAAGAGLLVGRLGRGLKAAHDATDDATSRSGSTRTTDGDTTAGSAAGAAQFVPPPPPPATTSVPPGSAPGGYDFAGYQQPPGVPSAPPPAPSQPPRPAPAYPPPPSYPPPTTPGYPQESSGRDLPR